jgi:hypothetical protein
VNNQVRFPMDMHTGYFSAGSPHMFSETLDGEYGFSTWWVPAEGTGFISVEVLTENPF